MTSTREQVICSSRAAMFAGRALRKLAFVESRDLPRRRFLDGPKR